jgi:hypothetical protein
LRRGRFTSVADLTVSLSYRRVERPRRVSEI